MPTVKTESIGRSLTLRELLRYQVRRLITWSIMTIVIILILIETLFSHLTLLSDQTIAVRPGLASTFSFLPFHPGRIVDTGFNSSQLNLTQINALQRLANGELRTITTLRTPDGLREWIDQLTPLLKDRKALAFIYPNTPGNPFTFGAINFAARIQGIDPENFARQHQLLLHAPVINTDCISLGSEQRINFDINDTDSLEDFIRAYVRYLALQNEDPSAEVWKLSRFIALRALERSYDPVAQREIDVLLEEIAQAKNLTLSSETLATLRNLLPPSQPNSCSMLAIGILIAKGSTEDKNRAEALLRATEPSAKKSLSEIFTAFRRSGIKHYLISQPRSMLIAIGQYRPLQEQTISDLVDLESENIDPEQEQLLENIALPYSAYETLNKQLHDNNNPWRQSIALRLLARAFIWLPPSLKADLRRWVQDHALERFIESNITLGVGLSGRQHKLPSDIIDGWVKRLSAGVVDPQSETDSNYTIVVDARNAVAALAMASATTPIPIEAEEKVEFLLANRTAIPLRQEAIEGLGARLRLQDNSLAEAIRDRLLIQRDSVKQRLLTVAIAIAAINGLQAEARRAVLLKFTEFWHSESEPELRKAYGLILAGAN